MAGIGGAAAISVSTPSLCRCSAPQSSSVSMVLALSPSFQHLIRVPRRCSVHLPRPDRTCSSSSHSGVSLRVVTDQTNTQQSAASFSPVCKLSSLEKSGVIQEAVSTFSLRNFGAFWAGGLVVGTAGAALADTFDVAAPSTSEGTPTEYFLSFLFFAAFIGLAVLTIGVIYLAVTDFLENRQRKAMQEADREVKDVKGEQNDVVKVGNGKGFGVRKVEKKSEKSK